MNIWEEADSMHRSMVFQIVWQSEPDGIKLTEFRKRFPIPYTIAQLFKLLEPMITAGHLTRDDTIGDNTYHTVVSPEEYCKATGESFLNFK